MNDIRLSACILIGLIVGLNFGVWNKSVPAGAWMAVLCIFVVNVASAICESIKRRA